MGMADHRGSTRPRPPWLTGKVDMWKEWAGMESRSVMEARTLQVMRLNWVVMSLSHVARQGGSLSKSSVRTSDARRCVSLCWVQVL